MSSHASTSTSQSQSFRGFPTYKDYLQCLAGMDETYKPLAEGLRNFPSSETADPLERGFKDGNIRLYQLEDAVLSLQQDVGVDREAHPFGFDSEVLVREMEQSFDGQSSNTWLLVYRYQMDPYTRGRYVLNGSLVEMLGRRFEVDARVLRPHFDPVDEHGVSILLADDFNEASTRMSYGFPSKQQHLCIKSISGVDSDPYRKTPVVTAQVLQDTHTPDTQLALVILGEHPRLHSFVRPSLADSDDKFWNSVVECLGTVQAYRGRELANIRNLRWLGSHCDVLLQNLPGDDITKAKSNPAELIVPFFRAFLAILLVESHSFSVVALIHTPLDQIQYRLHVLNGAYLGCKALLQRDNHPLFQDFEFIIEQYKVSSKKYKIGATTKQAWPRSKSHILAYNKMGHFVTSVFGMNVDVLSGDGARWWTTIIAAVVVYFVVITALVNVNADPEHTTWKTRIAYWAWARRPPLKAKILSKLILSCMYLLLLPNKFGRWLLGKIEQKFPDPNA
ncbi:MAG: hypothetical protein M1820_003663 [Bogoriella megaspora]|nr:MAG: hypothetical protein M1820_003663 [Bogoriella megaspora]